MKKILLFIVLGCWAAQAADRYVSTSGNNSWNGQAPAYVSGTTGPWRTIRYGIDNISAGDTLILRGGTYQEPFIPINTAKNGPNNESRTTIKSYPGERAVFQPTTWTSAGIQGPTADTSRVMNWTFDGWTIDQGIKNIDVQGANAIYNLKLHWVTNITFTNMYFLNNTNGSLSGVYPTSGQYANYGPGGNVYVVDCLFSNVHVAPYAGATKLHDPAHPMYWKTLRNVLVERNTFKNGHAHGLHVWSTPGSFGMVATNWVFRNNWIEDFSYGAYFYAAHSEFYNNVFTRIRNTGFGEGSNRSRYANNSVYSAGASYGIRAVGWGDSYVNNVVWGKWAEGIYTGTSTNLRYNTFTNNIAPSADWGGGSPTYQNRGNWIGSSYNPSFANPPTDLTLSPGSIAIGSGLNLSSVFTTDYNGLTRTTPWDRGAYKAGSAPVDPPEEPGPEEAIYVSTTGFDSGAGTFASPYRTIKKGLEMLQAGGTLILRGGNYDEPALAATLIKSGPSPSQRTIIKSYPGERAVFRPTHHGTTEHKAAISSFNLVQSNVVFDGWAIDGSLRYVGTNLAKGDFLKVAAHNWTLTNMWFHNQPWGSGIVFNRAGTLDDTSKWSSNCIVSSCTFSNWNYAVEQWGHPFYSWSIWHSTVENNLFTEGRRVAIQYGGVSNGGTTSDLVFRNNRITPGPTQSFSHGIYNNSQPQDRGTNTLIYNNIIHARGSGIKLSGRTNWVFNNTIVPVSGNFAEAGIWLQSGYPHIVANNIVWGVPDTASGHTILSTTYATSYLSNNIAGPKLPALTAGNVTQSSPFYGPLFDPLFLDAPNDLRLATNSPAIGVGVNLSDVFQTDIYGQFRQRWDLGAIHALSDGGGQDEEPPVVPLPLVIVVQAGPAYETGPTAAAFTISRMGNFTDDLDVNYTLTGTAVEDTNYTISPASPVTIEGGQNSVTVTVTPIDTQYIGALTVILTLDEDASYTLSSPSSATMEILGSGQAVSGFRRTFGGGPVLIRKKL